MKLVKPTSKSWQNTLLVIASTVQTDQTNLVMYASEILVSVGEPISFPEHLSSAAWPLLASLSAFWLRVSEKLSSLGHRDRVTLRHVGKTSDINIDRKKTEISISVNLSYLHPSWKTVFDSGFQTVSMSLSAKAPRDRWVMLLDLSVFCWWSVSVALRCVTGYWLLATVLHVRWHLT